MMGEELNAMDVSQRGILGDRAYALVDSSTGKVVSAKNPRKWPDLFAFRAALSQDPRAGQPIPPVRITLPDGTIVNSPESDLNQRLSDVLDREVTLQASAPKSPSLEEYWPDMEELDHQDTVTDENMPAGTFFDFAAVHVLTTATLDQLRKEHPEGRFEVRRFRPNIVVAPEPGVTGFVENDWVNSTLVLGDELRLSITGPCPRCVMTTLAQGDLPKDPGVLRTAAQHNQAHVGIYAQVAQPGTIRRGDLVRIAE
jgi:uncharacterized protein YcbX